MVNSLLQYQQNDFYDRPPWRKEEVPKLKREVPELEREGVPDPELEAFYERRRNANQAVAEEYTKVRLQARRERISRQYLQVGFVKRWQQNQDRDEREAEQFIQATEDETWDNTYGEDEETYNFDTRFSGSERSEVIWYGE